MERRNRSGGGRFGGRGGGGFGGRNHSKNRFSDSPRQMHKAICSKCGNDCEVPFKPAQGKPVYCKECYMKKR